MQLVNTLSLDLQDFALQEIPPYAILSHTWSEDEVTFQDMASESPNRTLKKGYVKILETCRLARESNIKYAWVDTCCIDKSSSAELTESINSMFGYYQRAKICFAHLEDLPLGSMDIGSCRWFTRGWTLQELLAPTEIEFFNKAWKPVGSKSSLIEAIHQATRIPGSALTQEYELQTFCVAERMSWAAKRKTTRSEDIAYSLLGIFDVNMPLIYGEGEKAFLRLQEEILKRKNDLTVLACEPNHVQKLNEAANYGMDLLGQSPAAFSRSQGIQRPLQFPDLSVTNKGLRISSDIAIRSLRSTQSFDFLGIFLGFGKHDDERCIFLPLRKIGPGLFCRRQNESLFMVDGLTAMNSPTWENSKDFYITMTNIEKRTAEIRREFAIYAPFLEGFSLAEFAPERLYEPTDGAFLLPRVTNNPSFPMVLAMYYKATGLSHADPILILCNNETGVPRVGVVLTTSMKNARNLIFDAKRREDSVSWNDFEDALIDIKWWEQDGVKVDQQGHKIIAKVDLSTSGERIASISLRGNSNNRGQSV